MMSPFGANSFSNSDYLGEVILAAALIERVQHLARISQHPWIRCGGNPLAGCLERLPESTPAFTCRTLSDRRSVHISFDCRDSTQATLRLPRKVRLVKQEIYLLDCSLRPLHDRSLRGVEEQPDFPSRCDNSRKLWNRLRQVGIFNSKLTDDCFKAGVGPGQALGRSRRPKFYFGKVVTMVLHVQARVDVSGIDRDDPKILSSAPSGLRRDDCNRAIAGAQVENGGALRQRAEEGAPARGYIFAVIDPALIIEGGKPIELPIVVPDRSFRHSDAFWNDFACSGRTRPTGWIGANGVTDRCGQSCCRCGRTSLFCR